MHNTSWVILIIVIVVAVVLGITASDLWEYFLELTRIAFKFFTEWLMNAIDAIKEALMEAL